MKDDSKETKPAEAVEKKGGKPAEAVEKKSGKAGWVIIPLIGIAVVAAFIFWPFGKTSTDNGGDDETEQTTPAPIIQIEVSTSAITGEYQWSNIPADKQALLTETATPDLNGENVLLVHKVTGFYPSTTMIWIQTQAADGSVRNIFTDEMYVKVK